MSEEKKKEEQLRAELEALQLAEAERSEIEQRLRESEQLLASVIRFVPDVVYRLDAEGRITFISDAVRDYGYEPEALVGRHILDLIHPEDRALAEHRVNERRTGDRSTQSLEVRFLTKAQEAIPFEMTTRPLDEGRVLSVSAEGIYRNASAGDRTFAGTQGIARNIRSRKQAERQQREIQDELARQVQERTARLQALNGQLEQEVADRRRAEEVLKASEQLYHGTIDAIDDIVHVVDGDLRITLVNAALRRRCAELGIPLSGLIGQKLFDLFPFLTDVVRQEYERVMVSGEPFRSRERTEIAGQEIWTDTLKVPVLEDGRVERIVTVVRDITDRERSRAALEESEAKYRQLFEMESDAVFLTQQADGQILEVNSAACELYGYSREELVARRNADLSAEPEETRRDAESRLRSVPVRYHLKKDGTVFPVEIKARHFVWRGRDVRLAAIRDITDRKRAEDEMVRLERLRALGEMSAGVSHNLNNILTGILGPAQLLLMDPHDDAVLQEARTICDSAIRARDLVQRLHQSVRGHEEDLAEPVDLSAIAGEAIRTTQPRWKDESEAKGKPIQVETRLANGLTVRGTPTSLHDVVVNLLVNAVDALPQGGEIVVETRESHGDVVLRVTDTGVGMDSATQRRVFEPFFTTKPDVGTGLGLSTVYGTVTRWGGSVEVESTPGSGTTFTVRLPLWQQAAKGPASPQPDLASAGRPGRLLLVEDDSAVAGFLEGLLSEDHEVVVALDGRDGLAQFQAADFDVVLIDLGLPGTPGDRLATQMREIRPEVATILITGWNLEDGDARLAAFDFRVKKPFDNLRRLLSMVQQGVALSDARSESGETA